MQRELAHAGIVVSPRGGRLRVSLHLYNDSADIAALVRALEVLETQSGPATTG